MSQKSEFILLSSPPASGKTYWISEFFAESKEEILVISPLRALADECRNKWGERVRVETPESWLAEKKTSRIIIFDEFHLLFYWGDSFRPSMWECFYALSNSCELMVGLTATVSQEIEEELPKFANCFHKMFWVDHGNQKLKNLPTKYLRLPNRQMMKRFILNSKPSADGVTLIFCGFRQEVMSTTLKLRKKGHIVWSCVGGESAAFSERVKNEKPPQFIVSTTVLSHGVNLPKVVRIMFMDPVNSLDFWIQMVARGGRQGEGFEVYSLEKPVGIKWDRFTNLLAILQLSFKMKAHLYFEHFTQWFLKAS
jgi:superfamily II DNA helicase RecQ